MMRLYRVWSATGGEHSFAFGANSVAATFHWSLGHTQMGIIFTVLAAASLSVAIRRVHATAKPGDEQ